MTQAPSDADRRSLPAVGRVLAHPLVEAALGALPRSLVVRAVRAEIAEARGRLSAGHPPEADEAIAERAVARATAQARPSLRPAINATGVILHTGLGRAVLPEAARQAVAAVAAGHSALEIDEASGRRGSRQAHVEGLLCELTGAESALVVNNNAGAVLLVVAALAAGREVVISRGELVEIGGAFRMPDIIRAGGAVLVEVGTTNRTRLPDYEAAIGERTGLLARCHPSNFRMVGFIEEAPAADLAGLGHQRGIPVLDDLGSGALLDTAAFGAGPSVTLPEAVAAGSDVVTASGDKLLGGPQSGIIVGCRSIVTQLAAHPLARALRADKMTLAALEATLRIYREPERALAEIPALRYLARGRDELAATAARLAEAISAGAAADVEVTLQEECSQVGGGSLPGEDLPTVCVSVRSLSLPPDRLAARLRRAEPALYGRVKGGALLLDPRTMEDDEVERAAQIVRTALATGQK